MIEPVAVRKPAARQLTVCVDDFGLHDGVNQAVVELLALGRISAVSCLVDGPAWVSGSAALKQAVGTIDQASADVGLHLNFTETLDVVAQSAHLTMPIGALIKACYLRQLAVPDLIRDIDRQWDAFEAVWGRAPDFVDGHQHAHQLPQIRDALAQVLARRYPIHANMAHTQRPWLRQCRAATWHGLMAGIGVGDTVKAAVIGALGAHALGRLASQQGLQCTQRLLGVYPFDADGKGYLQRWQTWLKLVKPQGDLLMCHPAAPMAQPPPWPDGIAASRQMEHAVLTSDAFASMVQACGVHIGRFGRFER
ncbi:MAG: ChbG/HpnK family deacetylase [Aquabacterium sp.]|nr:ChbG/HpnK family deacetylase [Aquabacterium sp.]